MKFFYFITDETVPHVIYSNRHELRSINLHTFVGKPLILSLKNTIALDFFYKGNSSMIFWTDIIDDKIYRGTLIGGCEYINFYKQNYKMRVFYLKNIFFQL